MFRSDVTNLLLSGKRDVQVQQQQSQQYQIFIEASLSNALRKKNKCGSLSLREVQVVQQHRAHPGVPSFPLLLVGRWLPEGQEVPGGNRQSVLRVQQKHQEQQPLLQTHTGSVKGQHTYNLSFRSGFSLEPCNTGVSLNRVRGE